MGASCWQPDPELGATTPLELEERRDGALVAIRPLEPGERSPLRVPRPGPQPRRLGGRGFTRWSPPPAFDAETLAAEGNTVVAALDPRHGGLLGVAWYGAGRPVAEAGVAITAGHCGQGIATALLERVAVHAHAAGVERFRTRLQPPEERMRALLDHVGCSCEEAAGALAVEAPVPAGGGLGVALGAVLWAVASGGVRPDGAG